MPTAADPAGRRPFPWLPTLMVVLAVPVLLGFGIWQMKRMQWKEAVLAELAANVDRPRLELGDGPIPDDGQFRRVRLTLACTGASAPRAGRNLEGRSGYAHLVRCAAGPQPVTLDAGWSARPEPIAFPGGSGVAQGRLVKDSAGGWILVSEGARPPLVPSAPPTVETISNNHFSYAIQWFSFAAILVLVYGIWLRRHLAPPKRGA